MSHLDSPPPRHTHSVLWMKPRASFMLGDCSTTEPCPQSKLSYLCVNSGLTDMLVKSNPLITVDRWTVGSLTWVYCDLEGYTVAWPSGCHNLWTKLIFKVRLCQADSFSLHQFSHTSSDSSWKPWRNSLQPALCGPSFWLCSCLGVAALL